MPSIAWRVNDKLSIGAGLNAVYGIFDQKVAINNAVPSAARPMRPCSATLRR
jgi:long-subunit fatty acid transport protein